MNQTMRSPAQQVEGLCVVWDLLPSGTQVRVVLPDDYIDTPALRVGDYEVVFASGGYDIWTAGGGKPVLFDLDAKQAVDALLERSRS